MSTLIDLSGPLYEGMWSYNSLPDLDTRLPELEVEKVTWINRTGFEKRQVQRTRYARCVALETPG